MGNNPDSRSAHLKSLGELASSKIKSAEGFSVKLLTEMIDMVNHLDTWADTYRLNLILTIVRRDIVPYINANTPCYRSLKIVCVCLENIISYPEIYKFWLGSKLSYQRELETLVLEQSADARIKKGRIQDGIKRCEINANFVKKTTSESINNLLKAIEALQNIVK